MDKYKIVLISYGTVLFSLLQSIVVTFCYSLWQFSILFYSSYGLI